MSCRQCRVVSRPCFFYHISCRRHMFSQHPTAELAPKKNIHRKHRVASKNCGIREQVLFCPILKLKEAVVFLTWGVLRSLRAKRGALQASIICIAAAWFHVAKNYQTLCYVNREHYLSISQFVRVNKNWNDMKGIPGCLVFINLSHSIAPTTVGFRTLNLPFIMGI